MLFFNYTQTHNITIEIILFLKYRYYSILNLILVYLKVINYNNIPTNTSFTCLSLMYKVIINIYIIFVVCCHLNANGECFVCVNYYLLI